VHYRTRLRGVLHYMVLSVLREVLVGYTACGRLHLTDNPLPLTALGGSRWSWTVLNRFWYSAYIQTWLVMTFLLESWDSLYQQPYNLSRSATKQRAHCGSLWLLSLHCAWRSASWKAVNNEEFLPHSGITENHSAGYPNTFCTAPTAYQPRYQPHCPILRPKGTKNWFSALNAV
jgi:hypothetical protein